MNKCLRCGHTWKSKIEVPNRCSLCNSPYWNKQRIVRPVFSEEIHQAARDRLLQFVASHYGNNLVRAARSFDIPYSTFHKLIKRCWVIVPESVSRFMDDPDIEL